MTDAVRYRRAGLAEFCQFRACDSLALIHLKPNLSQAQDIPHSKCLIAVALQLGLGRHKKVMDL